MFSREYFPPQGRECPRISRHEANLFVTGILNEDLPLARPPSLPWINRIIQAFHKRLPFQNITFLSKTESCCVPSWEEIRTDVLKEGKGGLCLSLNIAFAAIVRAFGVLAYTVPADYVATSGRSVHVLTVFHKCSATGNRLRAGTMHEATSGRKDLRRSSRLKQKQLCECGVRCSQTLDSFPRNSLYVADVGCGFPTRKSINLCEDLGRPFVDCGLEYCFMNNGHKFLRLHRTGDDGPEGEQKSCMNGCAYRGPITLWILHSINSLRPCPPSSVPGINRGLCPVSWGLFPSPIIPSPSVSLRHMTTDVAPTKPNIPTVPFSYNSFPFCLSPAYDHRCCAH
ncbi:uncharacterized protein LOC127002392 isoform X2 [Eriocheir sinensis]|uniref:uncharacterized protein LOC127002392 isoform X2 n=1 Tax=Eriocheir sinensis TaxID=95602 RepID=UPI0021C5C637|nr:uncharacterized protein LOC127002392 isoform X2 [Eriocheir sinensis]